MSQIVDVIARMWDSWTWMGRAKKRQREILISKWKGYHGRL